MISKGVWINLDATRRVYKHSKANGTALLVLTYIAYHINSDTGDAFPSVDLLVKETGMTRETITRAIQRLEASGELEVIRTRGQVNHYRLNLPELAPAKAQPSESVADPAIGLPQSERSDSDEKLSTFLASGRK